VEGFWTPRGPSPFACSGSATASWWVSGPFHRAVWGRTSHPGVLGLRSEAKGGCSRCRRGRRNGPLPSGPGRDRGTCAARRAPAATHRAAHRSGARPGPCGEPATVVSNAPPAVSAVQAAGSAHGSSYAPRESAAWLGTSIQRDKPKRMRLMKVPVDLGSRLRLLSRGCSDAGSPRHGVVVVSSARR
jgi:hypothetical protein